MNKDCHVDPLEKNPTRVELEEEAIAMLYVWGMGCPNCVNRVRNSLVSLKGVIEANVSHVMSTSQIIYNPKLATLDDLISAVVHAGEDGRHEYGAQLIIPQ